MAETDRLGDEIAEPSAHLAAATAHLLAPIREFDARGGWAHGCRSCAQWLSWRVGMGRGAAREHVRVARAHVYEDEDGMVVIRGRLTPEAGAVLRQALDAARETLYQRARGTGAAGNPEDVPEGTPSMAQQQVDALALLAETALNHGIDPGVPGDRLPGDRPGLVHVDAEVLADPEAPGQSVLEGGTHVSSETSRRLACDASRVVMRHDSEGRVMEIGARTRTIPPAIRRALHHRDHGCRFPGCGLPFGQGHHIRHWAQGGPTTLSNLAMLCRRHHRAVHEEGYQVERQPDGELRFRRPDGRPLPDVPPPPGVPDDPVQALRARNEAAGLLEAHEDQRGGGGLREDHAGQRREPHREQEQHAHDHRREPRPPALGDAGGDIQTAAARSFAGGDSVRAAL